MLMVHVRDKRGPDLDGSLLLELYMDAVSWPAWG